MAGSHGPADLVWIKRDGKVSIIQVKASSRSAKYMLSSASKELNSADIMAVKIVALRSRGVWAFFQVSLFDEPMPLTSMITVINMRVSFMRKGDKK